MQETAAFPQEEKLVGWYWVLAGKIREKGAPNEGEKTTDRCMVRYKKKSLCHCARNAKEFVNKHPVLFAQVNFYPGKSPKRNTSNGRNQAGNSLAAQSLAVLFARWVIVCIRCTKMNCRFCATSLQMTCFAYF